MKKWYIIGNENYIYHHGIKGQKFWRLNQNGFIR